MLTRFAILVSLILAVAAQDNDNCMFYSLNFSNGFTPQNGPLDLVKSGKVDWIVDDPTGIARKVLKLDPVDDTCKNSPSCEDNLIFNEDYFQLGSDNFTIEVELRHTRGAGNEGALLMGGEGGFISYFYNDYMCFIGWGCPQSNCCDWSQWNTHRWVREGSQLIQYINGVEENRLGIAESEFAPTFVKFITQFDTMYYADFKLFRHALAPGQTTPCPDGGKSTSTTTSTTTITITNTATTLSTTSSKTTSTTPPIFVMDAAHMSGAQLFVMIGAGVSFWFALA